MMKRQHFTYLKRVISLVSGIKGDEKLNVSVGEIKAAKVPVYQMIRDIVCDSRFYSVVENDNFWKIYSADVISHFIDSLTEEDWQSDECNIGKKEDFLNDWFAKHIFPISEEERRKISETLRINAILSGGINDIDENSGNSLDGRVTIEIGITDMTNCVANRGGYLPDQIFAYQQRLQINDSGMELESHQAEAEYLQNLDPTLVELAKRIGRSGGTEQEFIGKFQPSSRSDVIGITIGNDLNLLLPIELAMLSANSTEKVFYQRYAQKRLQLFSSASRSFGEKKEKSGPIYICVDTSGSMTGEPESVAKKLALAIAIVAQRDRRPVCLINYSYNISFFILKDLKKQRNKFMSFLSHSYGGGNDEDRLFNFIFSKLQTLPKYSLFAGAFKGADLLIISDFVWGYMSDESREFIADARAKGMNFYGLGVEMRAGDLDRLDDADNESGKSGYRFLKRCDHRYIYNKGEVTEYFDKRNLL